MKFSSAIAAVVAAVVLVGIANAQTPTPTCISQLLSCAPFLNSTAKPTSECCTAIGQVISTQLQCLCGLYQNPVLLTGINISQALLIPKHCGIAGDVSLCNNGGGSNANAAAVVAVANPAGITPALIFTAAVTAVMYFY
ncbi:hypothetical protein M569_13357 [Genlisea aurea]|uniref:Bifunctional inhibitor/plant lipid transfer protein/seed storage helical domain-containing protein n=1 Tax=Genlisea aurea TaxID=192259 RepID=S8CAP9_9LAMI|nr:hypothetical protein M569_13357 [Genlisea aurea]